MAAYRFFAIIILSISFSQATFATELYPFQDPTQATAFKHLTDNLRCLVCQNEPISQSNAPLAADLRAQIYTQLLAGKSEQDILDFVVARYGDYVLYKPPFNLTTFLLWTLPFIVFIIVIALLLLRRKNLPPLSEEEKKALEKWGDD
jgi:cytochrome c-type biogenesis protein CcmH